MIEKTYVRYHYGSRFRDGFNAEQRLLLQERNRAWNQLCDIANKYIVDLRTTIEAEDVRLVQLREELQQKPSYETKNAWKRSIRQFRDRISSIDPLLNKDIAQLIQKTSIWWMNKDMLYSNFVRALRTNKNTLRLIRHADLNKPHGSFTYRFTKGFTFNDLLEGRSAVKLNINGTHGQIDFPIHADGHGKYVYGSWEFTYHRPIPADAGLRGISVIGKMEGAQWRLGISFLLTRRIAPVRKLPVRCGLDVGWRLTDKGMRVATTFINGEYHALYLPQEWVNGCRHIDDIDVQLNKSAIKIWDGSGRKSKFPGWMAMERVMGEECRDWLTAYKCLRIERKNKKARLERQRLDIYKKFAADLANQCSVIHIEKLTLERLLNGESQQIPQRKKQQRLAAVSIIHQCIENSCLKSGTLLIRKNSAKTTTRHTACGYINEPSDQQLVKCGGCGVIYDQDENAALNIFQDS